MSLTLTVIFNDEVFHQVNEAFGHIGGKVTYRSRHVSSISLDMSTMSRPVPDDVTKEELITCLCELASIGAEYDLTR